MKTSSPKKETIKRAWHLLDAQGQVLGHLATQIAGLLMGKTKPLFAYHEDMGDFVVVVNATGLVTTGRKLTQKKYYRYTGYPGGIKDLSLRQLMAKDATQVLIHAVKGMLPKNKLRDQRLKRLKVYLDSTHPYGSKFTN